MGPQQVVLIVLLLWGVACQAITVVKETQVCFHGPGHMYGVRHRT